MGEEGARHADGDGVGQGPRDVLLVDGVKVLHDDGWALVFPDPEEPLTHVWAEAGDTDAGPGPGVRRRSTRCCSSGHRPDGRNRVALLATDPAARPAVRKRYSPSRIQYGPGHERPRRPPLHAGPRMGCGSKAARSGSGSPTTPRTPSATWCSCSCPSSGAAVDGGRVVRARSSRPSRSPTSTRPVNGTVVEVNAELVDAPQRLNEDPYGEGWICVIEPDDAEHLVRSLLDADGVPEADRGLDGGTAPVTRDLLQPMWPPQPRGLELLLLLRRSPRAVGGRTDGHHDHPASRGAGRRGGRRGGHRHGRRGPRWSRAARRQARAQRRVSRSSSEAGQDDDRPPSRQRHLPRRRHGVAPPRRVHHDGAGPTPSATSGSLNGTYLNRERIERGGACTTVTRCRSASSASCSCRDCTRGDGFRGGSDPSVDRRGAVAAPGGVPRRHHLQDPVPREPGSGRSRAHPVGLPQVLRARRRAAALDPAPAAGALPAAQGHQGPAVRGRR